MITRGPSTRCDRPGCTQRSIRNAQRCADHATRRELLDSLTDETEEHEER